ncbi:septation protein SepH [soil metagenome]
MKERDLTLVGLTEDKSRLVLVSDAGEEFTVAADARLQVALRGDHARLGQLEITMDSAIRPRDIQARVRAGESPESVAAAAQTTLDKVMGYATPVLAERAHVADRAQRASIRRKAGEGASRLLGDAVAERLRARNVDPSSVDWDAWRREDGRWTLVADYRSGESARHAEFVFDAPGRYIVAEDDEARWLVGETTASHGPQPRQATGPGRRLSAVPTDQELPLGEDAIELVSDPIDTAADEEPTVDLAPVARATRSTRSTTTGEARPAGSRREADWIATQASERPDASSSRGRAADDSGRTEDAEDLRDSEEQQVAEAGTRRSRKSRGRASVPSWDEIMFGGGKRD